jgi:hypothetical protein
MRLSYFYGLSASPVDLAEGCEIDIYACLYPGLSILVKG